MLKYVHMFLDGLGHLCDTIANIPPGQLRNEVGMVAVALAAVGVLKVSSAPAFADNLTAIVLSLAALGVAGERIAAALKK